jgi:hypothetical protein
MPGIGAIPGIGIGIGIGGMNGMNGEFGPSPAVAAADLSRSSRQTWR